jgi:hypothetical protein
MPHVTMMSAGESSTECIIDKNNDKSVKTTASEDPSNDENEHHRMIGEYTEEYLVNRAKEIVARRTKDWEITSLKHEERVPRLHRDEITVGIHLGQGGFFTVNEIEKITLRNNGDDDETEMPHDGTENEDTITSAYYDEDFTGVVQNRKFMQKHCIRKSKGHLHRYVLKTMKPECKETPGMFVSTMVDLAIECRFLATIRHPSIIKLRAVSDGFISSSDDFLVLDRLYSTLTEQIEKWKDWNENSFAKFFDFGGKKTKKFLANRLTVAYDVASALAYLHDR